MMLLEADADEASRLKEGEALGSPLARGESTASSLNDWGDVLFDADDAADSDAFAAALAEDDGQGPTLRRPLLPRIAAGLRAGLNSRLTQSALLLLTLYILFASDVRELAFSSSADPVFEVLSTICLFTFCLETLLRSTLESRFHVSLRPRLSFLVSGYLFSFLFWLDLIAIVSLLPEIEWIWGSVVGTGPSEQLAAARASRISRIGSRLGRIVRVVRVVRVFKIYSLWQTRQRTTRQGRGDASSGGPAGITSAPSVLLRESAMGQQLSDSTTRIIIILVLLMLLLVPVFSVTGDDTGRAAAAAYAHAANCARVTGASDLWATGVATVLSSYRAWAPSDGVLASDVGAPLLVRLVLTPAAGVPATLSLDNPALYDTLRLDATTQELDKYEFNTTLGGVGGFCASSVWFNIRPAARMESMFAIVLTLFIVLLLLLGALQFSADAHALVLRPLEAMLDLAQRVSINPATATEGELGPGAQDAATGGPAGATSTYETRVLENALRKVIGVLRVGLGSKGLATVARHLDARRNRAEDGVVAGTAPLPPGSAPLSTSAAQRSLVGPPSSSTALFAQLMMQSGGGDGGAAPTSSTSGSGASGSAVGDGVGSLLPAPHGADAAESSIASATAVELGVDDCHGAPVTPPATAASSDAGGDASAAAGGVRGDASAAAAAAPASPPAHAPDPPSGTTATAAAPAASGSVPTAPPPPRLQTQGTRKHSIAAVTPSPPAGPSPPLPVPPPPAPTGPSQPPPPHTLTAAEAAGPVAAALASDWPSSPFDTLAGKSLFEPFCPGRMVRAVFLAARIPRFDAIVETLGPASVIYFNLVAKAVHNCAVAWGGRVVESAADGSFLLAWVVDDAVDAGLLAAQAAAGGVGGISAAAPAPQHSPQAVDYEPGQGGGDSQESADDQLPPSALSRRLSRRGSEGGRGRRRSSGAGPGLSPRLAAAALRSRLQSDRRNSGAESRRRYSRSAAAAAAGRGRQPAAKPPTSGGNGSLLGAAAVAQLRSLLQAAQQEGADRALLAALELTGELRRSRDVQAAPLLSALRDSVALHGYRLRLCFGLDAGWAVEGAVGTGVCRVDATFLSDAAAGAADLSRGAEAAGDSLRLSAHAVRWLSPQACEWARACSLGGGGPSSGHPPEEAPVSVPLWDWSGTLRMGVGGGELPAQVSLTSLGAAGLNDADMFNVRRSALPDREYRVSILGGGEVIEHAASTRRYSTALFGTDPGLRALRLMPPAAAAAAMSCV